MKLSKIDLSKIVAINHNQDKLGLLIDRGSEMEYLEVSAPKVAYQGLNKVANLANNNPPLPESAIFLAENPNPRQVTNPTLSNTLSIANQPQSISYSASIEVDEQQKVVRVELNCKLEYSLAAPDDEEEEYHDFEDYFDDEEEDYNDFEDYFAEEEYFLED